MADNKIKILLLDIETSPLISYTWGLWDQNVPLAMIKSDWHVLAWAAKWLDEPPSKIHYQDQRNAKNIEDDSKILKGIWKLMDEADIIITQNGKAFDEKKLNARFILNGFKPPSPFKHVDTKQIASRKFEFTSNKLEYMTDKLCTKYKKLKHHKFAGFELWKQCLAGNIKAWNEMKRYNVHDVLSLEELYLKLQPWADGANSFNPNLYENKRMQTCSCGSIKIRKNGYSITASGKYQRYLCSDCGAYSRDKTNLLSPQKRKSLKIKV